MKRPVTPSDVADPILCGEFREAGNYSVWRPNGSGNHVLISTLAGTGLIGLGDRTIRLEAGQALLYGPKACQDYSAGGGPRPWHLRWAHFVPRPHWGPWLEWPQVAPEVRVVELDDPAWQPFQQSLERMLIAQKLGSEHADDLAMNSLEAALLWAHRVVSRDPMARIDTRLQAALRHLAAHPSEPMHVGRLAARCGLSVSRFAHLFKTQVGTTPRRYGEKLRLALAGQLLAQTALPVGEIAAQVGFSDALYFSRRFRQEYRHPPSTWRLRKLARSGGHPG